MSRRRQRPRAVQLPLLDVTASPETQLPPEVWARFDRMAGRCSGIPDCCIDAYVAADSGRLPMPLDALVGRRAGYRYRPCAACIAARRVVEVRSCRGACLCAIQKQILFYLPRSIRCAWLDLAERDKRAVPVSFTAAEGVAR